MNRCVLILSVLITVNIVNAEISYNPVEWENGYFINKNIRSKGDTLMVQNGDKWSKYALTPLPDAFIDWSVQTRMETFASIREGKMPRLAGAHNGMVASYGLNRGDSEFLINNAVKGMGFCPDEEHIDSIIKLLESTINEEDFEIKLQTLEGLYRNAKDVYAHDKLLSLELYSEPQFQTGTFINQYINPRVSIVFLDIPSYEIKAIAQMLHPDNPELTAYEKKVVRYANLIHSYFHGDFAKIFIAVIYNTIEVFDNSPGKGGKGMRMMPLLP